MGMWIVAGPFPGSPPQRPRQHLPGKQGAPPAGEQVEGVGRAPAPLATMNIAARDIFEMKSFLPLISTSGQVPRGEPSKVKGQITVTALGTSCQKGFIFQRDESHHHLQSMMTSPCAPAHEGQDGDRWASGRVDRGPRSGSRVLCLVGPLQRLPQAQQQDHSRM